MTAEHNPPTDPGTHRSGQRNQHVGMGGDLVLLTPQPVEQVPPADEPPAVLLVEQQEQVLP